LLLVPHLLRHSPVRSLADTRLLLAFYRASRRILCVASEPHNRLFLAKDWRCVRGRCPGEAIRAQLIFRVVFLSGSSPTL
jgi:hypothetical protein